MRIVAESVLAAGLRDDLARPASFGDDRLGILRVAQENDHAVVVSAAVVLAGERLHELFVVGRILGLTPGHRAWRRGAAEPRPGPPRLSAPRAHAKAPTVCPRAETRT